VPYENFDFVGSFNKDYAPEIDPQDTINMYESYNPDSPKTTSLLPWPGSSLIKAIPIESTFGCRGAFTLYDNMYFIFGQFIYQFSADNSYILIITLNTTQGHVDVDANLTEILFVDGSDGWVWNTSTNIATQVTDSNFPANPSSVTYLDGRFYVSSTGSNQFSSSAQEDGLTWPALEFAELTTKGDTIVGLKMLDRRVYVFGNIITEGWYDAGSPGMPLLRDDNISYGFGLASLASLAGNETVIIWLSKTRNGSNYVMMIMAGQGEKISTQEVDLEIQKFSMLKVNNVSGVSDAAGYIMEINGMQFYVLNFTIASTTLVYNLSTKKWVHLSMLNGSRYFGQYHNYYLGQHYIGDYAKPNVYQVSRNVFTNNGEPIKRTRITKIFRTKDGKQLCINMFEIQFVQGDFLVTPDSTGIFYDNFGNFFTDNNANVFYDNTYSVNTQVAPQNIPAYLSLSTDEGNSFGYEQVEILGNVGQFNKRCIWNRLGLGDSFVMKMDVYAPTPLSIIGANIQYDISRF
jgi:hypothetical protein